jgi:6-pyruvoyltetrahydropterin/6-carboxytetrahydropterin synthase
MLTVERYHDFSAAHRAVTDLGPCHQIHGHNYRVTFTFASLVPPVPGASNRIIDFGMIKALFVNWLEKEWDHKCLVWEEDPFYKEYVSLWNDFRFYEYETDTYPTIRNLLKESIAVVPFETSVENMAAYLHEAIGPRLLLQLNVKLVRVRVEETRKCSATSFSEGF